MKKFNGAEGWSKLRRQSLGKDKRIDALQAEVEALRGSLAKSNDIICQTLGKVLGFPWYKDDLDLFPGATESAGVCIGDHVAETMAVQAADRIRHLDSRLQIDTLNPNRREHIVQQAAKIVELEAELGNSSEAFCEAIEFAINTDEPRIFLQNWNEGEWGVLNNVWPEFKIHKSLTDEVTK
jgi:hypothetical protein